MRRFEQTLNVKNSFVKRKNKKFWNKLLLFQKIIGHSNQARHSCNGKVERSHITDERKFYQLLTYKDDVNLSAKLAEWESFYNLSRPHGAFNGRAPYEILRERL